MTLRRARSVQRAVVQGAVVLSATVGVSAQVQSQAGTGRPTFDFKPSMLDSKNRGGTTLGVEYALKGERAVKTFGSDDGDLGALDANATVRQLSYAYGAKGTLAADATRNPRNFVEFGAASHGLWSTSRGTFRAGARVNYEADQRFLSKQWVAGVTATYGKLSVLQRNDFVAVSTDVGRVDPRADATRRTVLAVKRPPGYLRANVELLYMVPLSVGPLRALELNYRLYTEPGAAPAIVAAQLDRHQLGTARLGLQNNVFVAYSIGSLPFDRRNDRVYALGWAYAAR
jgi:hypothetical protein